MDEKKETKYLDLSASCSVSVTEILQRFFTPVKDAEPEPAAQKEEKDDGHR